jgi:hypothetical protein
MRITETHVGGAAGIITGVVLWALTTYVFAGSTPDVVQAAVWVLVPGAVGLAGGFFTRRKCKVPEPAKVPAND